MAFRRIMNLFRRGNLRLLVLPITLVTFSCTVQYPEPDTEVTIISSAAVGRTDSKLALITVEPGRIINTVDGIEARTLAVNVLPGSHSIRLHWKSEEGCCWGRRSDGSETSWVTELLVAFTAKPGRHYQINSFSPRRGVFEALFEEKEHYWPRWFWVEDLSNGEIIVGVQDPARGNFPKGDFREDKRQHMGRLARVSVNYQNPKNSRSSIINVNGMRVSHTDPGYFGSDVSALSLQSGRKDFRIAGDYWSHKILGSRKAHLHAIIAFDVEPGRKYTINMDDSGFLWAVDKATGRIVEGVAPH